MNEKNHKGAFFMTTIGALCAHRLFDEISFQRFVLLVCQLFEDGRTVQNLISFVLLV